MLMIGNLPWRDPRLYAAGISKRESHWVLLYSGRKGADSGQYSILALKPSKTIAGDSLTEFATQLSADKPTFTNAWFGYLAYELRHELEDTDKAPSSPSGIDFPHVTMTRFSLILLFDHETENITCYGSSEALKSDIPSPADTLPNANITLASLQSNMDKNGYIHRVEKVKAALHRGDIYQANLTRKFYGTFEEEVENFSVFCDLSTHSPAPYSAYLHYDKKAVISSSPERFLHIDAAGNANMHPIKGSAPRGKNVQEDQKLYDILAKSSKDRAENLMIVDLCRNDLSRGCEPGSVKVDKLFSIEQYATVMHMVSSIHGRKKLSTSSLELVKHCFPPGSMTGAPKIMAMDICNQLEQRQRGIYSGAIGWFGGDGSVDLSVVIRTLLIDSNRFEFQVGGGIVLDSDPENEWRETLIKARGIGKTLGIAEAKLEAL